MKTYTIVVREINIDWRRLMTSSFEDFTKKAEAFLEEHITEYLSAKYTESRPVWDGFFVIK